MCKITEEFKKTVWEKATIVAGYDANSIRKDACGAWIIFDKYADKDSIFGWVIDHIYPAIKLRERNIPEKEIDNLVNLRPLNWLNDASKGNEYPVYHAAVISEGEKNIRGDYQFEIDQETRVKLDQNFSDYI